MLASRVENYRRDSGNNFPNSRERRTFPLARETGENFSRKREGSTIVEKLGESRNSREPEVQLEGEGEGETLIRAARGNNKRVPLGDDRSS